MTTQIKSVAEALPPYATHFETAGPLRALLATQLLGALVTAEGPRSTMPLHQLSQADVDRAFDVVDAVLRTNELPDDATPLAEDATAATIAELRAEVARLHAELDAATAPAPPPVTP